MSLLYFVLLAQNEDVERHILLSNNDNINEMQYSMCCLYLDEVMGWQNE